MQNFNFKNKLLLISKTFSTQIGLEILDLKTLLTSNFPLFTLYFFYFYFLFIRHLLSSLVDCIHWFVWFFRDIPEKRPVDTSKP